MLSNEERLNALSHALGIFLGLIGFVVLLVSIDQQVEYSVFSTVVYSITVLLLFTASTIYHGTRDGELKRKLRILDHISIYYLIAGTYTPVTLIMLENTSGWPIFYAVWGIAALGTLLKLFFTGRFEILSTLLYLVMGWLIVFDLDNLRAVTSTIGINSLFLGGAFYSIGIVFYVVKQIPYNHLIWHLFVLAGAGCHWFFIFYDVV
ncbi:MAG: hemolysin III family protein [Arenibacter sp.]|nr:hemolysin III family protein [Arenibacter sp.]